MKAIFKLLVLGVILFFGNKYFNEKGISSLQAADDVYFWIRNNWIKFSEIDTNKQITDSIQNYDFIEQDFVHEEKVKVKLINEKVEDNPETAMKRSTENIYSLSVKKRNDALHIKKTGDALSQN